MIVNQDQYSKSFRILSRFPDGAPKVVLDIASGFSGVVDYDGATVLSRDNENGWRLIPLMGDHGRWALLVWKMEGEFGRYQGLRRL